MRALRGIVQGEAPLSRDLASLMIDALHGSEERVRARDRAGILSSREREVLDLVAQGARNKQIASMLTISEFTAKRHVQNILQKLELPSRRAAATFYLTALLSGPDDASHPSSRRWHKRVAGAAITPGTGPLVAVKVCSVPLLGPRRFEQRSGGIHGPHVWRRPRPRSACSENTWLRRGVDIVDGEEARPRDRSGVSHLPRTTCRSLHIAVKEHSLRLRAHGAWEVPRWRGGPGCGPRTLWPGCSLREERSVKRAPKQSGRPSSAV